MYKKKRLLIFGFGYTSKFMCQKLAKKNWQVFCTTRFREKFEEIRSVNATPIGFDDEEKIKLLFDEDLYILKSEIVPPVCPACPQSAACPREEKHNQKSTQRCSRLEVGNNALKVTPTRRQGVTG